MAVTAGALSLVSKTSTTASLSSAAASGGTGPYTYQWYRSTSSGFTPGAGNLISGATNLTLSDSGLIPATTYYYKVVATDTGAGSATNTSAELAVVTSRAELNPNQFSQSVVKGMLDQRYNANTIPVIIDTSEMWALYPGQAVKMVDSAYGVPKVVACSADDDECVGFLNYNLRNLSFVAGDAAEISASGNVMWLEATAAVTRGAQVALDVGTVGGVAPLSTGGGNIVGWAFDKASNAGELIRVFLTSPSFAFDV